MPLFWRIQKGFVLIKLALEEFLFLFKKEIEEKIHNFFIIIGIEKIKQRKALIEFPAVRIVKNKPIIFASACVDSQITGGWKYNGGIKELNLLIKLVRNHGYEGYLVTYDGKYEPWLIEHQPAVSIDEFNKIKKNKEIRCVTSWAIAKTFIQNSPRIYFWDMELAYSENQFFAIMGSLYKYKINKVAGISRTIQAWHMAKFHKKCNVIPNIIDESIWFPDKNLRKRHNVGYMNEGPHTKHFINIIEEATVKAGLKLDFYLIKGDENDVLNLMRSCEVYLSLNIGKDPFWGEGCPRTILEALSVGCVSLSFDIIGNRETVINNFNGIIVNEKNPHFMADKLIHLFKNKAEMDRLRLNSLLLFNSCNRLEDRWLVVKDFLDI